MRVVHVNDVAGVSSTAVQQARSEGLDWRIWPLPAVRGHAVPVKIFRRGRDLVRFHRTGRAADVLHVHYGLFGYYAWSVRRPYLLHLHGTDVRVNLHSPVLRRLVLRSIRRAGAVVYSTPDLAEAVTALRADAVWLPAPVSMEVCGIPGRAGSSQTDRTPMDTAASGGAAAGTTVSEPATPADRRPLVVFASRWDPVKGLDALVRAGRRLRTECPEARLVGVDWGSGASRARAAGVDLVPMMPSGEFRRLIGSADVVVGQQSTGCLGISDLEAMALGRPLVARFTEQSAYGEDVPLWNTAEFDPVDAVQAVLHDPAAAAARARAAAEWVLRHHSPKGFVERSQELYRQALGTSPGQAG